PIIGVGRLDDPNVAASAVADGMMDVAAVGRGLLADPRWAAKVRMNEAEDIRPCVACYDGCFGNYYRVRHISCAVNPSSGRESAYRLTPAEKPRDVMVIGGGIAGLEAARVASIRGHAVSLYEKEGEFGGVVRQAAAPEFKKDLRRLLWWYERQIEKSDVQVFLNTEMTPDQIRSASPGVVVMATGADPIIPNISGVDHEFVSTAVDFLKGGATIGDRVAIVGGGLSGCEIAIWLAEMGKQTIIIEMLPELMTGSVPVIPHVKQMTLDMLARCGAGVFTDSRVKEITPAGVRVVHGDNGEDHIPADTVVLAMGMKPNHKLLDQIPNHAGQVYKIGDCREPRNIMNAVWDAHEIARYI
ncbi:MAG: FAD-dependent oxidoreductase, partial [Desulfobacterales bacterium]|nr:FAD-dependent oxidoreductase [Desulfobacterales bacterium]